MKLKKKKEKEKKKGLKQFHVSCDLQQNNFIVWCTAPLKE